MTQPQRSVVTHSPDVGHVGCSQSGAIRACEYGSWCGNRLSFLLAQCQREGLLGCMVKCVFDFYIRLFSTLVTRSCSPTRSVCDITFLPTFSIVD